MDCKMDASDSETVKDYVAGRGECAVQTTDEPNVAKVCSAEQSHAVVFAILSSTDDDCKIIESKMIGDGAPTNAQLCGCFKSFSDNAAIKDMDCKMDASDSETVKDYVAGRGECAAETTDEPNVAKVCSAEQSHAVVFAIL